MVFTKQISEAACKECFPGLLPVAVINTVTTRNGGGKGLFQLTLPGHTPSQQEFKAGTEAETIKEHGSLAYSHHAQPLFSHCLGPPAQGRTLPTQGWPLLQ